LTLFMLDSVQESPWHCFIGLVTDVSDVFDSFHVWSDNTNQILSSDDIGCTMCPCICSILNFVGFRFLLISYYNTLSFPKCRWLVLQSVCANGQYFVPVFMRVKRNFPVCFIFS
jgi:hypothetical protein